MTDEQLIAQIREETNLAKVDDEREDYRATRDYLIECCRAFKQTSAVKQYEQKIKRIDPFIAALDERAEKLRKKKT